MLFDSAMLAAIVREIAPLAGARVREIWMGRGTAAENESAEPRALFLQLGSPQNGATLLIDTHPQRARVHLVQQPPQGGAPTPFSDVLRRTLRGARLTHIVQPDFDRTLHLRFETRNAIGDAVRVTLVAEVMDRRSNAILLDENDVIIDALKRLPPFLNRVRTVLPHRPYEPPPGQRRDPRTVTDWKAELTNDDWRAHLREFHGISSLVLRFVEGQIAGGATPAEALATFFARLESADARGAALCGEQPYPFALEASCATQKDTLSALLEARAEWTARRHLQDARAGAVRAHLAKLEARAAAQRADLEKARAHAAEALLWQEQGSLVLAHLREVGEAASRGESTVELDDGVTQHRIAIEPRWPPADNATRLFNRARRARKLAEAAPAREAEIEEAKARIEEWRARLDASPDDATLEALARECGLGGADADSAANRKQPSRARQKIEATRPESKLRRADIEGWTCFMGRSAEENQLLLSKVASSSDLWLHLRGRPSAHVIIKNQKGKEVPPKVLDEAARWLANTALGQKGANSGERIEVIHTAVKWVRAIKGAPGKVTLQRAQTRLVQL
jgi:predicted ribosome quality control (RQC) complex YloA/Tae2 family protein